MQLPNIARKLGKLPSLVAELAGSPAAAGNGRLVALEPPAENPGKLSGFVHVPARSGAPMPLVVVLHGCTQDAAGYDAGSGWSALADAHGFALLYPEQARANNPNLCFNWFEPSDTQRGRGEVASIHAMIEATCIAHPIDRSRIFVTGLSAGGAMAGAMLATYPGTFAAGAIIAGVPYGCASGVGEAFECMSGRTTVRDGAALGDKVRTAAPRPSRWPRVSIWHGTADPTVAAVNADALAAQWANVHGLGAADVSDQVDGFPRKAWTADDGAVLVEQYAITGMGHGTPLKPGRGEGRSGTARAHMLDVGISSTDRIAAFFGIDQAASEKRSPKADTLPLPSKARPHVSEPKQKPLVASGPQKVIEDALRAAGLMR